MPSLAFIYKSTRLDLLLINLLVLKVLQLLSLLFTVLEFDYGLNVLAVFRPFNFLLKFLVKV